MKLLLLVFLVLAGRVLAAEDPAPWGKIRDAVETGHYADAARGIVREMKAGYPDRRYGRIISSLRVLLPGGQARLVYFDSTDSFGK